MRTDHIVICVPTYKRPDSLKRLLEKLEEQHTGFLFTYSVQVVDNDVQQSARGVYEEFKRRGSVKLGYDVEPQKNIALTRNRVLRNSLYGDYVAFIDDDEFPEQRWLFHLYTTGVKSGADGVLGPVVPYFPMKPPRWLLQSRICERPSFPTGTLLQAHQTRTGNVLFTSGLFRGLEDPFDPQYGLTGGEDVDFFKRMMKAGHRFVWSSRAVVFEEVPENRLSKAYYLQRAYLRGRVNHNFLKRSGSVSVLFKGFLKSLAACAAYLVLLPVAMIRGEHLVFRYLEKLMHHLGTFSAYLGVRSASGR